MKRIVTILSALALLLCGCSPRIAGGIQAESIPEDHPGYAVIYFYRTGNFVKTPYNVHLGDEVVPFKEQHKGCRQGGQAWHL